MAQTSQRFNFDSFDEWARAEIEDAEEQNNAAKLCLEGLNQVLYIEPDEAPPVNDVVK